MEDIKQDADMKNKIFFRAICFEPYIKSLH